MKITVLALLAAASTLSSAAQAVPLLKCTTDDANTLIVSRENFAHNFHFFDFERRLGKAGAIFRKVIDDKPLMEFENERVTITRQAGDFQVKFKDTNDVFNFPQASCAELDESSVEPLCSIAKGADIAIVNVVHVAGKNFLHAFERKGSLIVTDYGLKEVNFNSAGYKGVDVQLSLAVFRTRGNFKATYKNKPMPGAHVPPGYEDRTVEYNNMSCNPY
jgi:hypothetical protein